MVCSGVFFLGFLVGIHHPKWHDFFFEIQRDETWSCKKWYHFRILSWWPGPSNCFFWSLVLLRSSFCRFSYQLSWECSIFKGLFFFLNLGWGRWSQKVAKTNWLKVTVGSDLREASPKMRVCFTWSNDLVSQEKHFDTQKTRKVWHHHMLRNIMLKPCVGWHF